MPRFMLLCEPRTGSTYLQSLINIHFDVKCMEDFLSDEYGAREDPLRDVDNQLSALRQPVVGFKTFPEHLYYHNVSLAKLVRYLDIRWVVVLWRESYLEMYASLQIALKTQVWYTSKANLKAEVISVDGKELMQHAADAKKRWKSMCEGWPPDVVPIFVKYEDLVDNPTAQVHRILQQMSLDPSEYAFEAECCRQNPAPIWEKVSTWDQLSEVERSASLDIPSIVNEAVSLQLNVRDDCVHLIPGREPQPPPTGWRYRVCEPYITSEFRQNVLDAVDSGSVSSAGRWPQEMIRRLREIYGMAVAQPCCNGFAAIVLALRAADIGSGDDVMLPSFTMIAVPNAVRLVGARPVPIDCAVGDYNPSIWEIQAAATSQTKAVIVTHTYGVPTSNMEYIADLCLQKGWFLIEDISETAGIVTGTVDGGRRLLGTFGDFACASMYANKLLQAGDGGFLLAKDPTYKYRLGSLVNHGFTRSYHFVHVEEAPNFKISGLAAALACASLDSLEEIMRHRVTVACTYRRCLKSTPLELMPLCGPDDTPWVFGVCCANKAQRQSLRELLAKHGAETRNYFFPIHAQPAYRDQMSDVASLPNADKLAETGFYLPTYTALNASDIEWICSVITSYFAKQEMIAECPKSCNFSNSLRVHPNTLMLQSRRFDDNGQLVESTDALNHHATLAVLLRSEAEYYLLNESWDGGQLLMKDIEECIAECRQSGFDVAERVLQPFVDYIHSQSNFELPSEEPWTTVDLTERDLIPCAKIPTTTEPEVLQLLYWLVQQARGLPYVLELGSLFGASTAVMATAAKKLNRNASIVAVDCFTWQPWMDNFQFGFKRKVNESFLDVFQCNTSFVSDVITVVQCNIGNDPVPTDTFKGIPFDIVFFDFTRDLNEMETAWLSVKPHLKDRQSIVVLNSLTINTIPFVVDHKEELVPIAKPRGTRAKAFMYVKPNQKTANEQTEAIYRCLHFLQSPDWNHHQGRTFNVAIDALRDQLHSSNANVDFIPAVEEFICDFREQIRRPWIGIIHGVPVDDQFYPPDLKRLCSRRYRSVMKLCRGLFTLTDFQASYLRTQIDSDLRIPICPLRLPMLPPSTVYPCNVTAHWKRTQSVDLVFIGSFARDFSFFFHAEVPSGVRKVLLSGDEASKAWASQAPPDVVVLPRLDERAYEEMLSQSIVMVALKYNGAANTVILECIARNVPVVAPRIDSCIDYLGASYPLLYDQGCLHLTRILTTTKVQEAIDYLSNVDESVFSINKFCRTIKSSSVICSIAPQPESCEGVRHLMVKFDVTVCLCSYKRTNNLQKILDSLLRQQTYSGSVQVIIWNNNEARERVVRKTCDEYLRTNSVTRSLEVISSTSNHYCIIRACMLHLMRSDLLLICDDDILPKKTFIQFFVDAHQRNKKDVLAVRGHKFLAHDLNHVDPKAEWINYEHVRFVNDEQPEQSIHFLHADTCLIPREALQDFVSIPMPDSGFVLVDDYWMSFVLSHYFNRNLRKLQCQEAEYFVRTSDSDQVGLALYTRPEVQDAKIRMYIHHMLNGWPAWSCDQFADLGTKALNDLMEQKRKWWNGKSFIGYNVAVDLTREDVADAKKLGAQVVRIGAVGCREDIDFEFSGFLDDPARQMTELRETISTLAEYHIGVIITLHRRVASTELWSLIATEFRQHPNVIGYDLLNEPYVMADTQRHFTEVCNMPDTDLAQYFDTMTQYWQKIRAVDEITPIIVEPTFWGKIYALPHLSDFVDKLKATDPNIIVSVHFYEPQKLVSRRLNQGRYQFPGTVPLYCSTYSEAVDWNEETMTREIEKLRQWELEHGVKVFVGEFGVSRETVGAADYLRAVAKACLSHNISCLVYSFRESTWDAMNYELGPHLSATIVNTRLPWTDNPLTKALIDISRMNDSL